MISVIIPCLTYTDAKEAIEWLVKAFGFQKHLVVDGANGKIIHSELTLDGAMIMVGSHASGTEWSKYVKTPASIGGFETQSPYLIIDDVESHYHKAKKHGAKMVIDLKEERHGGKSFTCLDPEGHLWSFGSYNPLKSHPENK